MDPLAVSDAVYRAYNEQDFEAFSELLDPDFYYIHYNRGPDYFEQKSAEQYVATVRHYAKNSFKSRRYDPVRTTVQGNVVVREAWFWGELQDREGASQEALAEAGGTFRVGLASVHRFGDDGRLVEWRDYG